MNRDKKREYLKPNLESRKIELGVYGDYNNDDERGGPILPLEPIGKSGFNNKNNY